MGALCSKMQQDYGMILGKLARPKQIHAAIHGSDPGSDPGINGSV